MKTKIKAISPEKSNRSVSQQVNSKIPEVLIDYLFCLVKKDQGVSGCRHVFSLCKSQLGSEQIQEIAHIGENKTVATHRVFGFNPVDAEIIIICDETGCTMSLANDTFATGGPFYPQMETFRPFTAAAACNM
ncbi:MAG: hypothetical protein PHG73_06250 [Pygmaiobacter sp.]|jgi:hypothetical protein|nr:hypothetical protein [Pygmaiobacter sp.]